MTNKKILLINRAVYVPGEGGYKRTMYLFDMMKELGYQVTLLTSDFNHYKKSTRDISEFRKNHPKYDDIVFLHTPSYSNNISVKRYHAERCWTKAVSLWLKQHSEEYSVVMLSMPDMNTIIDIHKICEKAAIKMLIDVRDLRPEAFHVLVKNDFLYRILFFPMKLKANRAYACADELIAVSNEYLKRGLSANKKSKNASAIYIGATLELFYQGIKAYGEEIEKKTEEFWLTYVGTIGTSYDFETIIEAMVSINKLAPNVKLKIIGQGPEEEKLKEYASKIHSQHVEFLGFMPYEKMAAYLSKSDITLNNIKRNASQSIINKVADYYAAGVPMLNSCINPEMQNLIQEYQTGLNYEPENVEDFIEKFMTLYENQNLRELYGNNAKKLALSKFDRKNSYNKILEIIDGMLD